MRFTKKLPLNTLEEGKKYKGIIADIQSVKLKKGDYYKIEISLDDNIISIWVDDYVTPEHPLFELFDALIEDEKDAEDFDEHVIIGYEIEFTVKNIITKNKNGDDIERSFFNEVNVIFDE